MRQKKKKPQFAPLKSYTKKVVLQNKVRTTSAFLVYLLTYHIVLFYEKSHCKFILKLPSPVVIKIFQRTWASLIYHFVVKLDFLIMMNAICCFSVSKSLNCLLLLPFYWLYFSICCETFVFLDQSRIPFTISKSLRPLPFHTSHSTPNFPLFSQTLRLPDRFPERPVWTAFNSLVKIKKISKVEIKKNDPKLSS